MKEKPLLTVIIPTTAEESRENSLLNAINSINNQNEIPIEIILVINGKIFKKTLFESLIKRADLRVLYQEEGNLPKAIYLGVSNITTNFFCFLDDDDRYIENTLPERLKPLLEDNAIDYSVCNGFNVSGYEKHIRTTRFPQNQQDAAELILEENWLASCGGIFRKSSVPIQFFEEMPKYLEWTYLGFILSTTKNGFFLNKPGFMVYESKISISKSAEYSIGMIQSFEKIIAIAPNNISHKIKTKQGKMLHDLSSYFLLKNQLKNAVKFHLLSLLKPSGYKYISYSRHLIYSLLASLLSRAT